MFEKSKTIKRLRALLDANDFPGFQNVYERASFDVTSYRSEWGEDNRNFLASALFNNQPAFANFLAQRVSPQERGEISKTYNRKGNTYKETALYMAIQHNMQDLAQQLINDAGCDLTAGKYVENHTFRYNTAIHSVCTETDWEKVESPLDLAKRLGQAPIIEAIYNKKIREESARAADLDENALFFREYRVRKALEKIDEFRRERDELLTHANAPVTKGPTCKPKM
jgi:hypothetical protein